MSIQERNAVAPQMADYDRLRQSWVPYLMHFQQRSASVGVVSTDEYGLRRTVDAETGEAYGYGEWMRRSGAKGVVLGGSTAFGIGATADRHTVASLLNVPGGRRWCNLGGRAFNSTQELVLAALCLRPDVDRVLVMSGVNNLGLAYLGDPVSPMLSAFFGQQVFDRAMENAARDVRIGIRGALRVLAREVARAIRRVPATNTRMTASGADRYESVLDAFRRDLAAVAALARGHGATVTFALQPLATWMSRTPEPRETRIFDALDRIDGVWRVLAEQLRAHGGQYRRDVACVCADLGVPFMDLNAEATLMTPDWLFVDRVHLTDLGYARCAAALARGFAL